MTPNALPWLHSDQLAQSSPELLSKCKYCHSFSIAPIALKKSPMALTWPALQGILGHTCPSHSFSLLGPLFPSLSPFPFQPLVSGHRPILTYTLLLPVPQASSSCRSGLILHPSGKLSLNPLPRSGSFYLILEVPYTYPSQLSPKFEFCLYFSSYLIDISLFYWLCSLTRAEPTSAFAQFHVFSLSTRAWMTAGVQIFANEGGTDITPAVCSLASNQHALNRPNTSELANSRAIGQPEGEGRWVP